MPGLSDYAAKEVLSAITSKANFTNVATAYVALFSTIPTDANTGGVEAAYTSYARQPAPAASWNAASGSAPSTISNSASISFPVCTNAGTAVVETEIAFGLFDAVTSGNLLAADYLGNFSWSPFTCTLASPGVLTMPAHGFANGDKVVVDAEFGGTLPATAGSWAGLLTVANVTTDTFTAGVNTTGTGSGMVRKVVAQAIVPNLQPILNAGSVVFSAG